jgi:hypothetical protein
MSHITPHTFHIPVMGLGFTIDTPLKVAKYGITSVVSIMEDHLIEEMRKIHSKKENILYEPISSKDVDRRSKRIEAYLNFMDEIVNNQIEGLKRQNFGNDSELTKYFKLLPEDSIGKKMYKRMLEIENPILKKGYEEDLKAFVKAGSIDVNIMTKLDNQNYSTDGELLPNEYSDAKSALKGFANSKLSSSIIFSAGMNPRLYSYCESFEDFFPNKKGIQKKGIILKVSDFRSAVVQGKMFAKKGIWVSEFRIESGLNCGGHAFATQGFLLGPILEEFKEKRQELYDELFDICSKALNDSERSHFITKPELKITVQGGIGTSEENEFLIKQYNLNGTGWGSPFLLVPETTNVDDATLTALIHSKREDFYLSNSSPLGVPFNNFKSSSSELQRLQRISKNRAGSPCYKKFLSLNTEFTEKPICTASRQYQHLKIEQIEHSDASIDRKSREISKVMEKECLCEGLGASAILKNEGELSHNLDAVSICPGPNLYFFRETYKLTEMVDHIYGRHSVLNKVSRPHVFINEAQLYIDYLKKEIESHIDSMSEKQQTYFEVFKSNLEKGLNYYTSLLDTVKLNSKNALENTLEQIEQLRENLKGIQFKQLTIV